MINAGVHGSNAVWLLHPWQPRKTTVKSVYHQHAECDSLCCARHLHAEYMDPMLRAFAAQSTSRRSYRQEAMQQQVIQGSSQQHQQPSNDDNPRS